MLEVGNERESDKQWCLLQDVPGIIRYQSRPPGSNTSVCRSTYHLATLLSVPLAISLLLFWAITHGDATQVLSWEILPQSYLFLFAVLIALPSHRLSRTGRSRFLVTLKRISVGGIAETQDGKFGDIILADVFTSYAKAFGDLFVSACMFFSRGVSSTGIPDRHCGGSVVVPFLICVPSIIRLRQCLIEFVRVRRRDRPADGWGGQHLANAMKYASAFPVIILTALQQNYARDQPHVISEASLYKLWYVVFLARVSLDTTLTTRFQGSMRVHKLHIHVLLGRRQRLGPHPLLRHHRLSQPQILPDSPRRQRQQY